MKKYILPLLILSCSLAAGQVFAAAWTQARGKGQIVATLSGYLSSHYYDEDGKNTKSDVEFEKIEFNPFIEYGITNDLTVGLNPSLQKWNFEKKDGNSSIFDFRQCGVFNNSNNIRVNSYLFETDFFVRKKLLDRNNFVLSVQPLVKTPCLMMSDGIIQLIENTADFELRLLGGYGFKWDPAMLKGKRRPFAGQYHFINLEAAYRKRNEQFADQIKIDATAGFRFNEDLLFLGQIFSTFSNGKEPIRGIIGNTSLVAEEDDFYTVKAQIAAVRQMSRRTSLQLSLFKEVMGKNSGNGDGAALALWYSF